MSIREEFKTSFEHWQNNKMGFIFEMIRAIIVFMLLYALISFAYMAIFTAAQEHLRPKAVDFWTDLFPDFFAAFSTAFSILGGTPQATFGLIPQELIPLVKDPHLTTEFTMLFFFLAFLITAGLFGMGKEITETAGTYADGVITWIRKKFFPFLIGACLYVLLGLLPAVGLGLAVSTTYEYTIPAPMNVITLILMIMIMFFAWGMLSMYFPAVANGEGMIPSIKQTFSLTLDNFIKIFRVWTIYFILIIIWFIPMAVWQNLEVSMTTTELRDIGGIYTFCLGWNFIYGVIVLFILVPMMTTHLSRVYAQITGKDVY